jgi:putative redox protein
MKIVLERKNDAVHFEAKNEDGVTVNIDGSPEIGGQNLGVRPMQLLLMGLGGCSGIDLKIILRREPITDIKITIDAERQKDVEPSLFEKIHVHFDLFGALNPKKVERAVSLSMDKYCSVAKTLEKTATITYSHSIITE